MLRNLIGIKYTVIALCLVYTNTVWSAGDNSGRAEYMKFKELNTKQTFGVDTLPGEKIDIRTGMLSYVMADLSIPMNGDMTVDVVRSFGLGRISKEENDDHALGDWSLDVPMIALNNTEGLSCQTATIRPTATISPPKLEYQIKVLRSGGYRKVTQWWTSDVLTLNKPWLGISLEIPGSPSQLLIDHQSSDPAGPKYMTTNNWKADCLTNGGFLVTSPLGVKYTFDMYAVPVSNKSFKKVKVRLYPPTCDPGAFGSTECYLYDASTLEEGIQKEYATQYLVPSSPMIDYKFWYASKVEDRHGNKKVYSYVTAPNGQMYLKEVRINNEVDPVVVYTYVEKTTAIQGTHKILQSVTSNGNTINYLYSASGDLKRVNMPEKMSWAFTKDSVNTKLLSKVTNPQGGSVEYTYIPQQKRRFFRSNEISDPLYSISRRTVYANSTSYQNGLTGEYLYSYYDEPYNGSANHSWIATKIELVKETTTGRSAPGMYEKYDVYKFYNKHNQYTKAYKDVLHGLLVDHETYALDDTLIQSIQYEWKALNSPGIGSNTRVFPASLQHRRVLSKKTTTIHNDPGYSEPSSYVTEYYRWTTYGSPLREVWSNSISFPLFSVTKRYTYVSNFLDWQIDLPLSSQKEKKVNFRPKVEGDSSSISYSEPGFYITNVTKGNNSTNYTYHANGEIATSQNDTATSEIVYYDNYYRGSPKTITHKSYTINQGINPTGTVAWSEDAYKNRTLYFYDGLNRLQETQFPVGPKETVTWETPRKSITTKGSLVTVTETDGFGRDNTTSIVENNVVLTSVNEMYNVNGQLHYQSFPYSPEYTNSGGMTYQYDLLGRLIKKSGPDYIGGYKKIYEYKYDKDGRSIIESNENNKGNITQKTYIAYGSPENRYLQQIRNGVNSSSGLYKTDYLYTTDADGIITTTGPASEPDQYRYFRKGRKNTIAPYVGTDQGLAFRHYSTEPENGETVRSTNKADNLVSIVMNKTLQAIFDYDEEDKIKRIDYPQDNAYIERSYDLNGNLLQLDDVTNADTVPITNTWHYEYNKLNQLKKEILVIGEGGGSYLTIKYVYDYEDLGSTTTNQTLSYMQYPSGMQIHFVPNAMNQPTAIYGVTQPGSQKIYISNITYYPSGIVNEITFASGAKTKKLINRTQQVTHITGPAGTIDYGYKYNKATRNLYEITNYTNNSVFLFNWDYADELRRVYYPDISTLLTEYTYDNMGNIKTKFSTAGSPSPDFKPGVTYTYAYDSTNNRLGAITGNAIDSFSYDAYGNITSDGKNTYVYDYHSGLKSATIKTGKIIDYQYDGNKRLVKISKNGKSTFRGYSSSGNMLFEYAPQDDWYKEYIYIGSNKIFERKLSNLSTGDTDADGMVDKYEIWYGLNIYDPTDATGASADPDEDGRDNLTEYFDCSNPSVADIPGSTECMSVPRSTTDSDGDGVMDHIDNCILTANANQLDSDNDDYGNLCDGDIDNDGLSIWVLDEKAFKLAVDANDPVADLNGDGIVEWADGQLIMAQEGKQPGPSALHPVYPADDVDGDGVLNSLDNCINIPNTNQLDSDNDQYGNRCDADLNNDGIVTVAGDYALSFGAGVIPAADINADGVIDIYDSKIILSWQNLPPGPSAFVP